MTLRVEISIIPFGNEEGKRIIKTINISNIKQNSFGNCDYVIEVDDYKNYNSDTPIVNHNRADGAEMLVKKSLEKLGY